MCSVIYLVGGELYSVQSVQYKGALCVVWLSMICLFLLFRVHCAVFSAQCSIQCIEQHSVHSAVFSAIFFMAKKKLRPKKNIRNKKK